MINRSFLSQDRRIYLCRHGESDWNVVNRVQGRRDIEINAQGEMETAKLAEKMSVFLDSDLRIYSSPLLRASRTAEIIRDRLGVKEVCIEEGFNEIDTGIYTGMALKALKEIPIWEEHIRNPFSLGFEGGESYLQVWERMCGALDKICAEHEDDFLIVSHAGLIRLFVLKVLEIPAHRFYDIYIKNSALSCIQIKEGDARLAYLNVFG